MDDFLGVFIASSKDEDGWKNSRHLCQTLTVSGLQNFREFS